MTALALLAEEIGVNERTLRRAVNEGALKAERPSPRLLEMSLGESIYVRRRWALLSALRSALRTERNVRFAMLFGSAARGEDTERSDVDVIVDLRDASWERMLDLNSKISGAVGRSVDLVQLEDADDDPTFLSGALEVGRVLVDREGLWPQLRRRESGLRRRGREQDEQRKRKALARVDGFLAATG